MENNFFHHTTILLILILVFSSCNNKLDKDTGEEVTSFNTPIDDKEERSNTKELTFRPETGINGILELNNPGSSALFFRQLADVSLMDSIRSSPVAVLKNVTDKEYLILYQYEGSESLSFSYFEIGKEISNERSVITDYENFVSNGGLRIGMTYKDIVDLKGIPSIVEGDEIIYIIDDYQNSDFLKQYNMPLYMLKLQTKDSILIKIEFGFEYP